MRLPFGFELTRRQAPLSDVSDNRGWFAVIREAFAGAWQRNKVWAQDNVLAHHAVYACVTLIANDVAKLRPKLVRLAEDGIWREVEDQSPFLKPLTKPNQYQNHIQFKQWWIASKLLWGNTYVLKERDARGVVSRLYILDPQRVQVLVSPTGQVFYKLAADNLSAIQEAVTVPASEIIHDRANPLFHPLVGVSPLYAAGAPADIGLKIENNAGNFFAKGSNPSGILTAPGTIPAETAQRLKDQWESQYSGQNSGKVAVLGNGLKFESLRMSAVDSQMIEHQKWTAEAVCSAFHVPPFKIGLGQMPTYQNGETLNQIYYTDCLQSHIESWEACMDEGLGLDRPIEGRRLGVELDLDGLFRMDTLTLVRSQGEGVKAGIIAPNEARRKLDLSPVVGGDTPYMQQQNYSLAALDARDRADPFGQQGPVNPPVVTEGEEGETERGFDDLLAEAVRGLVLEAVP